MELVILFLLLQVADWWTTKRFLAVGVPEGMPHIRKFIDKFGINALLPVKLVIGAIIAWLVYPWPFVLGIFCVLFICICIWNYYRGTPK